MNSTINSLRGGLIISCQASPGSPFGTPDRLAAFARCAENAGAVGIRACHGENIRAIAHCVSLPIIGIKKREVPGYDVYITPELSDAREVRNSGAIIIATDATNRPRPGVDTTSQLIRRIHLDLCGLAMADIATFDEGVAAADMGADLVCTTMSGYTPNTADRRNGPDLELVERLANRLSVPVICEGRVNTPDQARAALAAGAWAVVVGAAITAPDWIAGQFVGALRGSETP